MTLSSSIDKEDFTAWDPEGLLKTKQSAPSGSLIDRHLAKRGGVAPSAPKVRRRARIRLKAPFTGRPTAPTALGSDTE